MLLYQQQLDLSVEMQAKSYSLLKWVGKSVSSGLLSFQTAHQYSTLPLAAADWIDKHYLNIPEAARVDKTDIPVFANFFRRISKTPSTSLQTLAKLNSHPTHIAFARCAVG